MVKLPCDVVCVHTNSIVSELLMKCHQQQGYCLYIVTFAVNNNTNPYCDGDSIDHNSNVKHEHNQDWV